MTDQNRIAPQYQGLREQMQQQQGAPAADAVSPTQALLSGMDQSARWAMEATERSYRGGGNEGEFTLNAHGETHTITEDPLT